MNNLDFYKIHERFEAFMKKKGYFVRQPEKLISPLFPTTFTMSGGPDLAYKFWQGDKSLEGNHIVNQPCIRHWDIDLVGDNKHLSFFNMFVADSIGGFSRKEVLAHFYDFFIKEIGLNPDRFYASYFGGGEIKGKIFKEDTIQKNIWLGLGIKADQIFSSPTNDPMQAFVANTVEPVGGPRAELFYDLRTVSSHVESVEDFWRLEKDGKFLEFFTHVLYNLEVVSNKETQVFEFKEMNREAVAAGFGPQRLLRILEAKDNIGDISILDSLKECLGPIPFNLEKEAIIVADHIRGLVFLAHDGIHDLHGSKNRSRKYLYRKYLRNFKQNLEMFEFKDQEKVFDCLVGRSISLFDVLFSDFDSQKIIITSDLKRRLELVR